MAVLGDLAKLKRSLGLAFGVHFLYDLFIKIFLISISMDKVSMSHIIFFSRYQTECVIKLLFGQLMTTLTLRFFLDRLLKQRLTRKKTREGQNTKI